MSINYQLLDTPGSIILALGIIIICFQLWWDAYREDDDE
jgi:hypothetical protein